MAKITALDVADQITGDEFLPIVQGANTKRVTMSAFRDLITPFLQYWYKGEPGDTGPSNNTRTDLNALKLAPIGDLSSLFDGSLWTWTTGDFTGRSDDLNVVKANAVALAVGAWVRQSDPADTRLNVLSFVPRAFRAAILGRTVNNNIAQGKQLAKYIQIAIDAAALQRRRLHFPAGLYNIAPREAFEAEGGTCQRCFAIRSYMDLYGEAGATFRIVDGVSTDAAVVFMCMFGTNEQLSNVSWRGLEMDMNGQKNLISPNRASGVYSLINQAMIFVTGTPGGNAALINDVLIDLCIFKNTPGVSCIVGAQSNSYNVALGRRWTITRNKLLNGGLDTVDHTAIYGWIADANVTWNLFENDKPFITTGGLVAYEIHGANTKFTHNTVRRFWQGMWIDNNQSERVEDVLVTDNLFDQIKCYGVLFFGINLIVEQTRRVKIMRNTVVFDNLVHPGIDLKIGFGAVTTPRGQSEIEISGNTVQSGGSAVGTASVVMSAPTRAGELHTQVTIDDNTSYSTTFGEVLLTNPTCGLGTISIRRNKRFNLSPGGAFLLPIGLSVGFTTAASQIDFLSIGGNQCTDDRTPSSCAYGTRIEGQIGVLDYQPETFRGMTQGNYVEASPAIAKRSGVFDSAFSYDPPSLVDGASVITNVAFPGAKPGSIVRASFSIPLAGIDLSAWVSANDTISAKFANRTGATVDLAAGLVRTRLECAP
ncbi:hypothetical protein [Sphingomonas sp. Leaf226]|uniref:hypothetical protein n=1 Tax=Sphingomonas sp. Leaf226 TaxID=1735691 RepID=UPI0006FF255C|nr:hypothetical protein [Sphingomonas sp. Leaf226]KQM97350.1 hypothetical protein ASE77_18445 [Sphingomonas sp. Leaf226]